jgi:flagellar biosynthesis/type III secretory pathway protein FliH
MNRTWIIYTALTVAYIVILVIYFLRRSKSHEAELTHFLTTAKDQVEIHKQQAASQANVKVAKAMQIVQKVTEAAEVFEERAQEEYNQIIEDAKAEKREIIASAKGEVEALFEQAEVELEEYKQHRQQEIERNLVKMVTAITERVVETAFTPEHHKELIYKALEEIKTKKARS